MLHTANPVIKHKAGLLNLPCRRTGSPVRQKPITPGRLKSPLKMSKAICSNREQSMVVVQAPTLSQKDSSVSLSTQTLSADSHSTATLTFIAHDAAGNPVIGLVLSTRHEGVQDITLSDWKDNGDGSYTQILTTGAMSGTLTLMPQLNGVLISLCRSTDAGLFADAPVQSSIHPAYRSVHPCGSSPDRAAEIQRAPPAGSEHNQFSVDIRTLQTENFAAQLMELTITPFLRITASQ